MSAGAPFWSPSVHIPEDKQSILADDQLNFEIAESKPYLSVLTFLLFALGPGPESRAILHLTFYLHGQGAQVDDEITCEITFVNTDKNITILLSWVFWPNKLNGEGCL